MTRRQFIKLAAGVAAVSGGLWRVLLSGGGGQQTGLKGGRRHFPGRVRVLNPNELKRPAMWLG